MQLFTERKKETTGESDLLYTGKGGGLGGGGDLGMCTCRKQRGDSSNVVVLFG